MKAMFVAVLVTSAIASFADAGPRLTDAEFFSMLDPDRPGMEKTIQAVKSGDYQMARHEFAEHMRNRTKPVFTVDSHARPRHESPPPDAKIGDADRILKRELPSVGVYHKFDGEIDWTLDPINYKEWPFQLNRHPFWVTLGRAYWATGDEKYAREFVYQMTDWVAKNPIPATTSGNQTNTWRTIEQGIRCSTSWPESFYLFLSSPSFTDDAIVTMVKSFVEHARQLMKYHTGGNWLTMEADGLMHVGVLFPEFKEADEWRKTAADRLFSELDHQVYPDGAQVELTTGYHQVALQNFVRAWEIARMNDVPMPDGYVAKLERMYNYNLSVSMPDGTVPGLNDGNRASIRTSLEQGFGYFPKRTDFEWMATSGKNGTKPALGSVALPFSGQLVMRTGWDARDRYLLMDAGPFGHGHQHEDALSIVLYADGKYHVIDPGNYAYDSSQWRRYVLSARGHNTVMVDGLEQNRRIRPRSEYVVSKPLPNKWATSDQFDFASGTYDRGYGPKDEADVKHTRSIFFVKPEYWIITDLMTPSDGSPHRYDSIFHLDADSAVVDAAKAVRTINESGGNLSIIPLGDEGLSVSIVSGQEQPVVQGWMPDGNLNEYKVKPIPTPIFTRESSGPTWLAYVLYPTRERALCPVTGIRRIDVETQPGTQAIGLRIDLMDDRTDYFVQADRRGPLKFAGYETDALAAYVRTQSSPTVTAVVVDGVGISQSSNMIPAQTLPVRDLSRTTATQKL